MEVKQQALYLGNEYKEASAFNGRNYPERYIMRFLTDTMEVLEFSLPGLPDWVEIPTFKQMILGNLTYEVVKDSFATKQGRGMYRSLFTEFVERGKVSFSALKERSESAKIM